MGYQVRGKTFDDLEIGDEFWTANRTVTEADIALFTGLSGDFNPLHTDQVMMEQTPFGGRIAHGMLIASIATGQINQLGIWEGTTIALLEVTLRWTAPVKAGDTIRTVQRIVGKKPSSKPDRGTVAVQMEVFNQRDDKVMEGDLTVLVRKEAV